MIVAGPECYQGLQAKIEASGIEASLPDEQLSSIFFTHALDREAKFHQDMSSHPH